MTDPLTPAQIAEALDARANDDDAFEREIVNNGGAVSTRAKARVALDRAAAAKLREMELALKPFADEYDQQAGYWPDMARVVAWAPFRNAYRITIDDLRAARSALGNAND